MRIAICDDDLVFSKKLEKMIISYFEKKAVDSYDIILYDTGTSLLNDSTIPDIVFLDVKMPDKNGISVGHLLKQSNKDIVILITTAFSEYIDLSMDIPALRFIKKPVDDQRLSCCLESALKCYYSCTKKIIVETRKRTYSLNSSDIIMVDSLNGKVTIHTRENTYTSIYSISYWKNELNFAPFYLTHRSFIINFDYVSDFDKYTISLCDGAKTAYLTKRAFKQFKDNYYLYIESTR